MTSPIDFLVPGLPAPQPRPRARIMFISKKPVPQIYNPADADEWKAAVRRYALASAGRIEPLDIPLRLCLSFRMLRPMSHYLKSGLRPGAPVGHIARPDLDNLEKAVMDALTGVLWRDDSLICQKYAEKLYAREGDQPGVRIKVTLPILDEVPDPTLLEAACQT